MTLGLSIMFSEKSSQHIYGRDKKRYIK